MISANDKTLLGLSIATRPQRRRIVIAYYTIVLLLSAVQLIKGNHTNVVMFLQVFNFAGIFGGIRQGIVKNYEEATYDLHNGLGSSIQTLDLNGRLGRRYQSELLDERERLERDHAHYLAYRLLRWSLGITAATYWLLITDTPIQPWLFHSAPTLLWTLVLYIFTLPQAVILWTEPDQAPDSEMQLVPARQPHSPIR